MKDDANEATNLSLEEDLNTLFTQRTVSKSAGEANKEYERGDPFDFFSKPVERQQSADPTNADAAQTTKGKKLRVAWGSIFVDRRPHVCSDIWHEDTHIIYYETVICRALILAIAAFISAVGASWLVNVSWLPRPGTFSFWEHIGYWLAVEINNHFNLLYQEAARTYLHYIDTLNQTNSSYIIGFRQFLGLVAGLSAGVFGAWKAIKNPVRIYENPRKEAAFVTEDRNGNMVLHINRLEVRPGTYGVKPFPTQHGGSTRQRDTFRDTAGNRATVVTDEKGTQVIADDGTVVNSYGDDHHDEACAQLIRDGWRHVG
ncbi:hypothetical protein AWB71_06011 [Caballeronia peredens]|nr:hypothetical protein AWB71_06011 [Caballeronia peredens]